jgi:hypothetical protein
MQNVLIPLFPFSVFLGKDAEGSITTDSEEVELFTLFSYSTIINIVAGSRRTMHVIDRFGERQGL